MQLNLKYNDEKGDSEFTGSFTNSETEFLIQYAVQTLMKNGLLMVQQVDEDEVEH